MLTQARHRFTVADFRLMAGTGVIRPDARVELLNGEVVDMSPIGPLHGGLLNRLVRLFGQGAAGRWIVSVQNPVSLGEHSEPQPDLMLLKPQPDDYTDRHPGPEDVLLLIEVADSTLRFDREEKLPVYAQAGIVEVWIVNLVDQVLEVFREPDYTGYGWSGVFRPGDPVAPLECPDLKVDLVGLFRVRG